MSRVAYIEVPVDLMDFEDDDLIEELKARRKYDAETPTIRPASEELKQIYECLLGGSVHEAICRLERLI